MLEHLLSRHWEGYKDVLNSPCPPKIYKRYCNESFISFLKSSPKKSANTTLHHFPNFVLMQFVYYSALEYVGLLWNT